MKYAKGILISIGLVVLLDVLMDMIVPDRVVNAVLVVMAGASFLGLALVAIGTVRKNRWGINQEPVICPACGFLMPRVRQPKSLEQALWGGYTCAKCGCEMDKWGRLVTATR